MKRLASRLCLASVLAAAGAAQAGSCGPNGCAVGGAGPAIAGGYALEAHLPLHPFDFNRAWLYPYAGFTVYPGQAGSCIPSHSDYSKVNWTQPPGANAQGVLNKLQAMGIPLVPPEPMFLGKNPRAAEGVKLPVPRGWVPKEREPDREEDPPVKPKEPEKKDPVKPKEPVKPKNPDDDL